MSFGPLVEQAILNQVASLAIIALVIAIIIGVVATILIRRRR
jgi:predicted DNA repair protein MutK